MRAAAVFSLALLLSLAACSSSAPAARSSTTSDAAIIASAKADIDAANSGWAAEMRAHDAQSIAAAYTDDGLFIARDGSVVKGREAVANMYASRFPQMRDVLGGDVVQDGVTVAGPDTIYEWGHAWLEVAPATAGQPPVKGGGKYLTVWQRQSDGHWRITRNVAF